MAAAYLLYNTLCFHAYFRKQVFGYVLTSKPGAYTVLNAVIQEEVLFCLAVIVQRL